MKKFFGRSRIIKTGVAVLLTAYICELFGWPPVFAVITAIVTIEPTVSDSIKKGIVRFPASAIGSAYAVTFISLFGNSPITYTLAAVFTIATCYKLKLHDGLLVATLTAVAMIEVIHDHFFIAFLIRLGTTTIGLVVSTIVNMFVFPPHYLEEISKNIDKMKDLTANAIHDVYQKILNTNTVKISPSIKSEGAHFTSLHTLKNHIQKTEKFIQFQRDEVKYQPFVANEKVLFQQFEARVNILEIIHDKLSFIAHHSLKSLSWKETDVDNIQNAVGILTESLRDKKNFQLVKHLETKRNLIQFFKENETSIPKKVDEDSTLLPPEIILLYELLAIFDLVEDFYQTYE